ncbi:MAG: response regulator [Planctomycetes bacterium]|nr:response regulator [Planctomycetota bacterium]
MSGDRFEAGASRPMERKQAVVFTDDEPEILLALERMMRTEPFDLLMTTDPEKALHWLRTRNVAVVISDQRMPEMDGTEFLRKARIASPRSARILLTAFPYEKDVLEARAEGLMTLLVKPWNERELRREIRDRLREREIAEGV